MLRAEDNDNGRDVVIDTTNNQGNPQRPQPSSPTYPQQGKKMYFNMANKIQIIPHNRQGQLNTTFLATVPGVLKIAEIALAFISFILAICSDRKVTTAAWTEHISFQATIIISALLLGYVCFPHLTIKDEQTREGLIVVELIYYLINTMLFFIAIWLMLHLSVSWNIYGRGSAIIDSIICAALTILFGIETVIKYRAWRYENTPISKIIQGDINSDSARKYDNVHELRRDEGPEIA